MADRNDTPIENADDPVAIPLDPEDALRALLKVDPKAEPVEDDPAPPHGDQHKQRDEEQADL